MRKNPFRDLYVRRENLALPLAEKVFSSIDSALSRTMLQLLREDPLSFVNTTVDPKVYGDASSFRGDYLCVEMFSKYPFLDIEIDRKRVAFDKFLASEAQCHVTNCRLSSPESYSPEMLQVLLLASKKIERLLKPFDWNEAVNYMGFGPGSTTRLKRDQADLYYKLSGIPECTPNCEGLARAVLKYFTAWGDLVGHQVKLVPGNAVITVPKNAKTDRVIAKEPCMNIFIQKGIGGIIRSRLKRVGVNLNDQTKNQRLAYSGSLNNDLSTIDLSAASDTVSLEICRLLLPKDWFDALIACRSPSGVLPDGTVVTYRKVSSMGNGYTFELESLLFWAICSAVRDYQKEKDRRLAIYGDDIIVPTGVTQEVMYVLDFVGFTPNVKKTHIDGPFRESCGKHYWRGVDVTPVYIRDKVDSYPRYIWCANQLKRWSAHPVWGIDTVLKDPYDYVVGKIEGYWSKPRIPDGMGDGALIGDFDEVRPVKAPRGWGGWMAEFFVELDMFHLPTDAPTLLKALYSIHFIEKRGENEERVLPNLGISTRKRRYSKGRRAVWQWQSMGPWLTL